MKYLIILVLSLFVTSCACYNCPKVYKKHGVPVDVRRPRQKNMKQNKYSPSNPYYKPNTN